MLNFFEDDDAIDVIYDYLTLLTGDCSEDYIIKFPGDPDDIIELTHWVRSGKWKHDMVDKAEESRLLADIYGEPPR